PAMTIPLMILGALSVAGGVVGIPPSLGGGSMLEHWLEPLFEPARTRLPSAAGSGLSTEYLLMAASVFIAAGGIACARLMYIRRVELGERIAEKFTLLYRLLLSKYYVDELYEAAVVGPIERISQVVLWKGVDVGLIDGMVNGSGKLVEALSGTA